MSAFRGRLVVRGEEESDVVGHPGMAAWDTTPPTRLRHAAQPVLRHLANRFVGILDGYLVSRTTA
jgi:hypothetical protein